MWLPLQSNLGLLGQICILEWATGPINLTLIVLATVWPPQFVFVFDKLIFLFNFFINLYVDMTIFKCEIIFLNIILMTTSALIVPKVYSVYHIGLRTLMLVS